MEIPHTQALPPPPGVINTLKAGFDAVTTHIGVILMPVVFDVLLWLGPRLHMDEFVQPLIGTWASLTTSQRGIEQTEKVRFLFANWNLFDLARTYPVGVSSLLGWLNSSEIFSMQTESQASAQKILSTPLGGPTTIQVSSILGLLIWLCALTLFGWIGGSIYYYWTSLIVHPGKNFNVGKLSEVIPQTVLLSVIWMSILFLLGFPVLVILTVISVFGALVTYIAVLFLSIIVTWLLLPIFFSAHGIFTKGQGAFRSILGAFQFVRFTAPTSSLFAILAVMLSQGLNLLWSVPSRNSWMLLVGIAGHAFITTALLAASFIYYREMSAWLQNAFEQMQHRTATLRT